MKDRTTVELPQKETQTEDVLISSGISAATQNRDSAPIENQDSTLFADVSNPCFQYKSRYIITPLKSGLVIIDQHRAHVRVLYEQYIGNIRRQRSVSQPLLFPEIIELTAAETSMLTSLTDEIRFLGFDLAWLGGNSYAIHAIPAEISGGNPVEQLRNIIFAAMESVTSERENRNEKMALSLAKQTAIRAGKVLTTEEMELLVASLFALDANGITPDGLPVLTVLTDEELSKRM
jgi:DNA mismatch repair protein MutL